MADTDDLTMPELYPNLFRGLSPQATTNIRFLMGSERHEGITPTRETAAQLVAIANGKLTYEEAIDQALAEYGITKDHPTADQ